jgi:hypothetical protein
MNLPKCNLTRCTLRESCQRFDEAGTIAPIMPFLPSGLFNSPSIDENPDPKIIKNDFDAINYDGPVNGCADYWPQTTGFEWFAEEVTKTPISTTEAVVLTEDPELPPNQLRLF